MFWFQEVLRGEPRSPDIAIPDFFERSRKAPSPRFSGFAALHRSAELGIIGPAVATGVMREPSFEELSRTLSEWRESSRAGASSPGFDDERLYRELQAMARHRMAHLPPGDTMQPTALVHEVWLRLDQRADDRSNKRYFFAAATRAMRDILAERARAKSAEKRGGGLVREHATHALLDGVADEDAPALQALALRDAIVKLESEDARKAEVVMLRFFGGLQQKEIADLLDVTERTVERDWRFARAWLRAEMDDSTEGDE